MKDNHKENLSEITSREKGVVVSILFLLTFLSAVAIRLLNADSPKTYFRPFRQYESLVIARDMYFRNNADIPQWRKDVAHIQREDLLIKGPQVTEYIVSVIYRLTGGEFMWIPGAVCSAFWLIGGIFIFLTAMRFVSPYAAIVSASFYLLVPFGIVMSRSFQPESLMIMMFTAGIYTIVRYYQNQSRANYLIMTIISGLAILAKFNIIFALWTAFIFALISKRGLLKAIFSFQHIIFLVGAILPAVAYYSYLTFVSKELDFVAGAIFRPDLLRYPYFWVGWFEQIGLVVGLLAFAAGLVGIFTMHKQPAKYILCGLLAGYFLYGILFTFTTPTHDYYQVQLIPIIALALAAFTDICIRKFRECSWRFRSVAIAGTGFLLCILIVLMGIIKKGSTEEVNNIQRYLVAAGNKCFGLDTQHLRRYFKSNLEEVNRAKEIGEIINHNTKTITLGKGQSIVRYYGEYAGFVWPDNKCLWDEVKQNMRENFRCAYDRKYWLNLDKRKNAEDIYNYLFAKYNPQYFIVADIYELKNQTSIKPWLFRKYRLIAETDAYMIFDLNRSSDIEHTGKKGLE